MNINWINLIAFTFWIVTIVILLVRVIKLKTLLTRSTASLTELLLRNDMLLKKIDDLYKQQNEKELSNTDGFIKFISDSRDWAFQYIENVQQNLAEFDKAMTPIIEWNNSFGTVLGDNPHQDKLKQISEAYTNLKLLLPDETKQGEI
jgi:CRISPR/Cas system CMR subunit Cmr4 (Cas7 group RAMP superfamily)